MTYNGGRQGLSNKTTSDPNICSQRNLLGFNDITVDNMGRVIVAYADGCVAKCKRIAHIRSMNDVGTVMRLTRGRGVFRRFDGRIR